MLRRFMTLVLCACLALQGGAVAWADEAPCPMESDMRAMVLSGEIDPADLPGCCNDLQTWAETGQLCKPGLDGTGLVVWAPAPAPATVGSGAVAGPLPQPAPAPLSAPVGAPWRPPTGA